MTPEAKIMNARMKLRKEIPYIGDILLYMQPEFDNAIGTMGVNSKGRLTVSPAWVDTLEPAQVMAVMIHEVLHILLLHPFREPPDVRDVSHNGVVPPVDVLVKHHIFNIACDLKINFMFHEMDRFKDLPPGGVLPDTNGNWTVVAADRTRLTIREIDKKSVERIYRELLDFHIAHRTDVDLSKAGNHEGWGASSDEEGGEQLAEQANDWMVRAAGALSNNKGKGTMPASLERELDLMLTPVIEWQGKLQRFVQPIIAAGTSYRRPRRSSWVTGIIMPGRFAQGVHILVHVDTSGSMTNKELAQILAELYGILDAYPHVRITLLHSDAGKPHVIDLRETDAENILELVKFKGGGGTSHEPVVDWVLDENDEDVKALICFTDGDSDIERCFNRLAGIVFRMLMITSEKNVEKLKPFCEDSTFLPVG